MECTRCRTSNPEGKKFCGDCGASLDPQVAAGELDLRRQIEVVLEERLKDQKVVEIEVAQAVATRLVDWTKLLGFAVAAL